MLHFALLLYLLSFTTGIAVTTALGFLYLKSKAILLRFVILTNIFLGLVLLFDSISYYLWLSRNSYPEWFYILLAIGQYSAIVWKTYFLIAVIQCVLDKEFSRRFKIAFLTVCYGLLILIDLLYNSGGVSPWSAWRMAFFISNIIAVSGSIYCVICGFGNLEKMNPQYRQIIKVGLLILLLIEPISIAQNVLSNLFAISFPAISMSAILFFLLNSLGIFYLGKFVIPDMRSKEAKRLLEGGPRELNPQPLTDIDITPRESEILKLVADGCNNQEISEALFISPNTVKNHIYNIYKKIGVKNRIELLNYINRSRDNMG